MYRRPHHQRIEKLLRCFNQDLLLSTQTFFAGGTAIVLSLDEYRESVDVDFLCASKEGYRQLRDTVTQQGLGALLKTNVKHRREVRADRYGIRTVLEIDSVPIKVEFVSEERINIHGDPHPLFGIPTLSKEDMYAGKLLANTDRGGDKGAFSRDIIDLAMMIASWGPIPESAFIKARLAYGESVGRAYRNSLTMITDRQYLRSCLLHMQMEEALLDRIPVILGALPAQRLDDSQQDMAP